VHPGRIRSRDDLDPNDWRRSNPRLAPENFEANLALADTLRALAAEKGCTPAQLALAWLLAHDNVVPIPGTRRIERLEENVAAADIVLTDDERARIESAIPQGAAAGTRYPAPSMAALGL